MTAPSAQVIADSVSPSGVRLTTLEVVMHRFVLAEFNTHRVFSRNSASSRAIPVAKQIQRVMDDPALPLSWPSEQKGMQGGEELDALVAYEALLEWKSARNMAVRTAESLVRLGVHKSVTNRLLEPFMWHTVVVTATDWDGFFAQRCSPLAQPEIRAAAEAMQSAMAASRPRVLGWGGWHLPYVDNGEDALIGDVVARKVSAARCARVSYLTHDGRRDVEADLALYDRLVSADPGHWSPLEHVATPAEIHDAMDEPLGNFRGWHQLRHLVLDGDVL